MSNVKVSEFEGLNLFFRAQFMIGCMRFNGLTSAPTPPDSLGCFGISIFLFVFHPSLSPNHCSRYCKIMGPLNFIHFGGV